MRSVFKCKISFETLIAKANTYLDVVLIRLNRLNDECCVELRMSKPAPPVVAGGTIVIGNDDGSLNILSIESGSSSMAPCRSSILSLVSLRRVTTSSLNGDGGFFDVDDNNFLTNPKPSVLFTVVLALGFFSLAFVAGFDEDVIEVVDVKSLENDIDCSSFCKYIFNTEIHSHSIIFNIFRNLSLHVHFLNDSTLSLFEMSTWFV